MVTIWWTEVGEANNPFQPGVALAGSLQGDNESPRKRSVEGNNRRNVNDGWVLGGGGDDDGGDDGDGDGDNDGGDGGDDDKEEEEQGDSS